MLRMANMSEEAGSNGRCIGRVAIIRTATAAAAEQQMSGVV
jgi:hypothetical protein